MRKPIFLILSFLVSTCLTQAATLSKPAPTIPTIENIWKAPVSITTPVYYGCPDGTQIVIVMVTTVYNPDNGSVISVTVQKTGNSCPGSGEPV